MDRPIALVRPMSHLVICSHFLYPFRKKKIEKIGKKIENGPSYLKWKSKLSLFVECFLKNLFLIIRRVSEIYEGKDLLVHN